MSKPDIVNAYHKANAAPYRSTITSRVYYPPIKALRCKDGFTMSVQASESHYCSPREDAAWPYGAFELGFPSEAEPLIAKYAETPEKPTETVYGWVPRSVVEAVIEKHGGLAD